MPHSVSPVVQPAPQPVELQIGVVPVQCVPHAPQFNGSIAATLQSVSVLGQRRRPGAQSHAPEVQVSCAPQVRAHDPQCVPSVRVSISQPLVAMWSQSANPI